MCLAYLVYIFEPLTILNIQTQERNTNIFKFMDSLKAFRSKLENWKRKVNIQTIAMFDKLSSILVDGGEDQVLSQLEKNEIMQHLTTEK